MDKEKETLMEIHKMIILNLVKNNLVPFLIGAKILELINKNDKNNKALISW